MNSQSQPNYAVNKKIAAILLVMAGLIFVSFVLFRSATDKASPTISQEVGVQQPVGDPVIAGEDGAKGTIIRAHDSEFGSMLFDGEKQAIYIWELENSTTPECYGSCAVAWPPVLTDGTPIASTGVNSALLGTTQRTDGTTQVTYNGHPLYYYAHEGPGEVKCHDIRTHGGLWWVIQPNGIRAA
jgi:predicted lipoprotein with Yx(FWY)xxD motif